MNMSARPRAGSALLWSAALGVALALGCEHEHKVRPPDPPENPLFDPTDPRVNQQAPDSFRVQVTTSRGDFVIEVHREWAPRGVDRFYNLVTNGFYDECRFFRVIFGRWAQFGISGDPAISAAWRSATIPDDPVLRSNRRGYVSFARFNVADSRTTQIFINFGDNSNLDTKGDAPFGLIDEDGMYVAARLFSEYADGPPWGTGPDQARIQSEGNPYLATFYPRLDYIVHAVVMPSPDDSRSSSRDNGDACKTHVSKNPRATLKNGVLRREAVIMLNAAEDGEGHEHACLRRWLPQLWVRVGNPVNRLRWPGCIVILNEFHGCPASVIDAEEDEVVQGLLPQRGVLQGQTGPG